MPLFTFDEELFASEVQKRLAVDSDPLVAEKSAAKLKETNQPVAYIPIPQANDNPRMRRRSSVYRRLSVRSASLSTSHGLAIPSNFVPEDEPSHKRVLADFEPLKVLGQGAYGKVHLVRDRVNGRLYAQKQIRKPQVDVFDSGRQAEESQHDDEQQDDQQHEEDQSTNNDASTPHVSHIHRTIAERHILSKITHHTNIVKLFYALQDHDRFYLLLEYIPGGELFHHLTSNNSLGNVFLEEHVAFYSAQMALGLAHLHLLGIVYRDLKPENCLLNTSGNLVLTDFGLSKAIGNDEDGLGCRSIIGTPEYMAPEIIKGEPYDYAVDWWLLGCVIYDMMTGKPPFTGKTHKVILDKIIKLKPVFPYYLSLDAKDLLGKLLQKNPAKRFAVDDKWKAFQDHRFFRKINWYAVQEQIATPPIVPVISDPALAENFADEFTGMRISDYDLALGQHVDTPAMFKGFSYTASHSFIDRFG